MHSCETLPPAAAPATGPNLLLQLGKLIIRARSASPAARAPSAPRDRLLHAKLLASKPSTSQVQTQPKPEIEEKKPGLEAQLSNHILALWHEQIPICIEVLLAPDCPECYASLCRVDDEAYDRKHNQQRALLLERWTMRALVNKSHEKPAFITSQWLLNAVRSQLHFSQLSAWLARLKRSAKIDETPTERRRKLSRETCNFKKLEANCDEREMNEDRKLNIVYSIKIPGESYKMAEFSRPVTDHTFPITDIGDNIYLKVSLESLPRTDDIPNVKCSCQRHVKTDSHEDLAAKLNDLTLSKAKFDQTVINSNIGNSSRRLSIVSNSGSTEYLYTSTPEKEKVLDDRMHTDCNENGKHKCCCDEESDNQRSSISLSQPKKLDERRLKEIAKYKRRLRKEKLKNYSTSSEGDGLQKKEIPTSIPILQASRFDRFRAIGCYRNQTYLTLPASRIESKSPFTEAISIPPENFKKTNTVSTQTDDLCECGGRIDFKCQNCSERGMVRSEASYNIADIAATEKHNCDINSVSHNSKCDNNNVSDLIKRPKLRRLFPIVDRMEKVVTDRMATKTPLPEEDCRKPESKRQKTFSISDDDYVLFEKCDYGTIDSYEMDSPKESENGFQFPDSSVPSPKEVDRFRYRFDSAASMVFHTKTGLPLTSSPAPLRRGNNCFDFDDSINGISGIKSALFHPISPPSPNIPPATPSPTPSPRPPSPVPPVLATPPPQKKEKTPKLRIGPSTGLLGSFEESALKGRLEPVATVHGFTAELGASGAFCPPHKRLPVTVFFYAPGGTNAPYMGHINLGSGGYRVARSGTIQVSLFNPHGTLVKMFVVLYDLTCMPPLARTFLRQRTLYMPAGADPPAPHKLHKWLRYLIHLRFMTSKSGKLYLHTDIRIIVSRKADLDTATAHSALFRPIPTNQSEDKSNTPPSTNQSEASTDNVRMDIDKTTNQVVSNRAPNRVFGGCSERDFEFQIRKARNGNQNGVSYELRSFTYAPENPKYSPR